MVQRKGTSVVWIRSSIRKPSASTARTDSGEVEVGCWFWRTGDKWVCHQRHRVARWDRLRLPLKEQSCISYNIYYIEHPKQLNWFVADLKGFQLHWEVFPYTHLMDSGACHSADRTVRTCDQQTIQPEPYNQPPVEMFLSISMQLAAAMSAWAMRCFLCHDTRRHASLSSRWQGRSAKTGFSLQPPASHVFASMRTI